jgi:hypothetical protein
MAEQYTGNVQTAYPDACQTHAMHGVRAGGRGVREQTLWQAEDPER